MTFEQHGVALADVREARGGNAIGPGLALFTGASFLVYLLVKLAAGTVAADVGTFAQIALSAVLLGWGGWQMKRGRFHFVTVQTEAGTQRIPGLSKGEQTALLEAFRSAGERSAESPI